MSTRKSRVIMALGFQECRARLRPHLLAHLSRGHDGRGGAAGAATLGFPCSSQSRSAEHNGRRYYCGDGRTARHLHAHTHTHRRTSLQMQPWLHVSSRALTRVRASASGAVSPCHERESLSAPWCRIIVTARTTTATPGGGRGAPKPQARAARPGGGGRVPGAVPGGAERSAARSACVGGAPTVTTSPSSPVAARRPAVPWGQDAAWRGLAAPRAGPGGPRRAARPTRGPLGRRVAYGENGGRAGKGRTRVLCTRVFFPVCFSGLSPSNRTAECPDVPRPDACAGARSTRRPRRTRCCVSFIHLFIRPSLRAVIRAQANSADVVAMVAVAGLAGAGSAAARPRALREPPGGRAGAYNEGLRQGQPGYRMERKAQAPPCPRPPAYRAYRVPRRQDPCRTEATSFPRRRPVPSACLRRLSTSTPLR